MAFVDEPLHAEGDFDGVEVLPLDVLDEGHGVEIFVVDLADVGGQGPEVGTLGRAPAAFAADDDIFAVVGLLDRDGLDDAQLADRIGQFVERLLVELRARLRGVGDDVGDVDFGHPAHGLDAGVEGVGAEDGVQAAAQSFLLFHGVAITF